MKNQVFYDIKEGLDVATVEVLGEMLESIGLDGAKDLTHQQMLAEVEERGYRTDIETRDKGNDYMVYLIISEGNTLLSIGVLRHEFAPDGLRIHGSLVTKEEIARINKAKGEIG